MKALLERLAPPDLSRSTDAGIPVWRHGNLTSQLSLAPHSLQKQFSASATDAFTWAGSSYHSRDGALRNTVATFPAYRTKNPRPVKEWG